MMIHHGIHGIGLTRCLIFWVEKHGMAWDSLLMEVDFLIGWNRFKTCNKNINLNQNGMGLHSIHENRMRIGWNPKIGI